MGLMMSGCQVILLEREKMVYMGIFYFQLGINRFSNKKKKKRYEGMKYIFGVKVWYCTIWKKDFMWVPLACKGEDIYTRHIHWTYKIIARI